MSRCVAVALLLVPIPGLAQDAPDFGLEQLPAMGDYTATIPIPLPPFRSITPKLALVYASSLGNGFVGVGWRLRGFSVIERVGWGKGPPKWDQTDRYLLDGEEIVPDTSLGGTHSTKRQSFSRIVRTADRWSVWTRDGVRTDYAPVLSAGLDPLRWGVESVTDPNGNAVSYRWWCDGTDDCYPDQITFPGALVAVQRELRPAGDQPQLSTGRSIVTTRYRLTGVTATGLAPVTLAYRTSPVTQRSCLQRVQRGTLPPITITTSDAPLK